MGVLLLILALFAGVMIGSSGTDTSDSGLEQRQAEEGAAGEAQRDPQPEPEPEPAAPLEFSGTGPQATEQFDLSAGLARFEMTYDGERYFIVELLDDEGNEIGMSLANTTGSYDGSQAVQIPEDGTYLLNVDTLEGNWTIRVQQ
jgi:hypothetical protein